MNIFQSLFRLSPRSKQFDLPSPASRSSSPISPSSRSSTPPPKEMLYDGYRYCTEDEALDVFYDWTDSVYGNYFLQCYVTDTLSEPVKQYKIQTMDELSIWIHSVREIMSKRFFELQENHPSPKDAAIYISQVFTNHPFQDYNDASARYRFMACFATFIQISSFCQRYVRFGIVYMDDELAKIKDECEQLSTLAACLRRLAKEYNIVASFLNLNYNRIQKAYSQSNDISIFKSRIEQII